MIAQGITVRNKQGLTVGRIEGKVYVKYVYGSKHMLREPAAWAIDAEVFDRAVTPLCYSIRIIDRETGRQYVSGVDTFRRLCQVLDRGNGRQYYLELVHWIVH